MADIFAPKTNTDIAFEQPVAPVQNRAAETLVRGLGGLFQDMAKSSSQAKKSGPDPLKAGLIGEFAKIEQQRAQGQTTKATMNERIIMRNYVAAGGSVDAELKAMIESTTGRPFDYTGQTEEQRQFKAMTESEEFQTAYVAAQATLGPDATEEQITQAAIQSSTEQAVAADTIARIRSGEKVNWELQGAAAYDSMINNFHKTAIGGLTMITQRGGMMTPQDVLGAKQSWDMMKASPALSRPKGISDDQWAPINDRIVKTDKLFETLAKSASSEQAVEQLQSVFIQSMGEASDMSFDEILGAIATAKAPDVMITNAGINMADTMSKLALRSEKMIKESSAARLIDTLDTTTAPDEITGNTIVTDIPDEYAKYRGTDPGQHLKDLKANGVLMSTITLQDMTNPEAAAQFADGLATTGVVLLDTDRFLSAKMLRSMFSDKVGEKLAILDQTDPDTATEARVLIRSGLDKQIRMLEANEQSIAPNLGMTWDEDTQRYYVTDEKAQAAAKTFYKTEMTDKGLYIDPALNKGYMPAGYTELLDRRKAINTAKGVFDSLSLEEPDKPVNPQELMGKPLDVIANASTALGWDENKQTDLLKDFLSAGGVNIDPSQTAWCAAFVNATLSKSGLDGTGMLNARSFLDWGKEVKEPVEGDIVVLSRGNNPAQGHVGFFKGFDSKGNIMILGGNQGDEVNIKSYPPSRLLGYRRADGTPLPVTGSQIEREAPNKVQMGLYGGEFPTWTPDVPTEAPAQPEPPEGVTLGDAMQISGMVADEGKRQRTDKVTDYDMERAKATSKEMTSAMMVEKTLTPKQKRQIKAAGFDMGDVEFFETSEDAEAALAAGEVSPGTLYVDKLGNVFLLE